MTTSQFSWPSFENVPYFCRALLQKRPSTFCNKGLVVTMSEPHTMKNCTFTTHRQFVGFLSLSLSLSHTHMLSLFLCRPTRSLSFSVSPTIQQKRWVCGFSYYKMAATRKLPKLLGLLLKTSPIFVGLFCKRNTAFFSQEVSCVKKPHKNKAVFQKEAQKIWEPTKCCHPIIRRTVHPHTYIASQPLMHPPTHRPTDPH